MAIRATCDSCFREYQIKDHLAGKLLPCKSCGEKFHVPRRRESSCDDDFDEPRDFPKPRRSRPSPRRGRSRKQSFNYVPLIVGGVIVAGIGLIAAIGIYAWNAIDADGDPPAVAANSPDAPFEVAEAALPSFPELGNPIRQLPGGTALHFVDFNRVSQSNSGPGTSMKMRVYLPPGEHQPGSIPCMLVAPAGTNLLVGNDMDADDYHDETLPYAQAGMAVVFYSIDGGVDDLESASNSKFLAGYKKFRAAGAGVVNGRNALEYVLAKVPPVDPKRIYCAGHSSAGTLSLLLAQHEPRIRACVAYAAATDVEKRLEEVTTNFPMRQMFPGLVEFVKQSSPKTHIAEFQCSVFLFHALDDGNVPASDSRTFAAALRSAGKQVTLRNVPIGNHYQSMIEKGIPQAIAWLQREQGAGNAAASNPTSTPTTAPPGVAQQPASPLPSSIPFPTPPVPRGPDPSRMFNRPPTGVGGPRVSNSIVLFAVLGFTGEGDKTAAVRKAMTGIGWADTNASFFDAKTNEIVVPVRVTAINTGIAKSRLEGAGFKIGSTQYRPRGR
jgi:acetyl esterase/lipase